MSLIITLRDRPPVIIFNGWKEFVSVHDQDYLAQKKLWRQRVASVHPDRLNKSSAYKFRRMLSKFQSWKQAERIYYWRRGLMPPDWKGARLVQPPTDQRGYFLKGDKNEQAYRQVSPIREAGCDQAEDQVSDSRPRLLVSSEVCEAIGHEAG